MSLIVTHVADILVVVAHDNYFTQRSDVVGVRGLSSLQKVTAALQMLAYGTVADSIDDYVRIGKIENAKRGFPVMLGSIDCMHWKWKNYPTSWKGSLNDINVLDRSYLFEELAEGRQPQVKYTINENEYNMGYYLADGIYPFCPTFIKTITKPQGNKRKYFATAQESIRKDVERAFGVLQSRFAMLRGPSQFWHVETMKYIMTTCIILHNMIIEDERDLQLEEEHYDTDVEIPIVIPS
ncbi:uncharacterized protein LOC141714232 [Apium graveolens]|uniref:uncharacterized protein LOC141714232 n=1 Tax=Apium graveolens TaxID=4045 RepID=UPI003D797A4F